MDPRDLISAGAYVLFAAGLFAAWPALQTVMGG